MFLGDQSCSEPREGTGPLKQGTSAAPYLCKSLALRHLNNASEEVLLVGGYGKGNVQGRSQSNSLEDSNHLAGSKILELTEALLSQPADDVAAGSIETTHPHGHHTLLDLNERYLRDVGHAGKFDRGRYNSSADSLRFTFP